MNYRKLWEFYFGKIPIDADGRSYEIHHIDGNNKNNEINNLKCVTIQEHYDIHFNQGDYQACMVISTRMKSTPNELKLKLIGLKRNDNAKQNISKSLKGRTLSELHKKSISNGLIGHLVSDETKKKISKSLNNHTVTMDTKLKISKSRKGIPAHNKKSIIQFDSDNNVVCEWNSITDASSILKINNINKVLNGTRKSAGGFVWKYKI